jgi:hypothetical protein
MSFVGDVGSDALMQAYFQEVEALRKSMMGDPQTDPNDAANTATMQYYLEQKAIGIVASGIETIQTDIIKAKTDDYYSNTGPVATAGKDALGKELNVASNAISETITYYKDEATAGEALVAGSTMVTPTTVDNSPTQFPPANPLSKVPIPTAAQKVIDGQAAQDALTKDYFATHNVNAETPASQAYNNVLPSPGEDVLGHNGDYGKALNNALKFVVGDGKGGTQTLFKSWATRDNKPDTSTSGTPEAPFTDKLNAMLEEQRKQTPGSYRFFIEKLHGKSITGDFYKKNAIKSGVTRDQIPNRMVFPAYITTFNDNYALGWSDYKFIGRGEKVYMYEETTRTMALEFYMMSDFSADLLIKAIKDYQALTKPSNPASTGKLDATQGGLANTQNTPPNNTIDPSGKAFDPDAQPLDETEILKELQRIGLDWGDGTSPNSSFLRGNKTGFVQGQYSGTPEQLWARYTFLAQCCYAWYRKDGKMKEQPFIRLRIGDFFDVICKIDSLDFTQDEFDVDLNPSVVGAIPMGVKVAMRLTIIHEDEANSEYARFYWRRDFDGLNVSPQALPDNMQETSKTLDSTLDKNTSKSPISTLDTLSSHGMSQNSFPNDVKAVQNALKTFGGAVGALQASVNSNDLSKIAKIKAALLNAKRLLIISKLVDAEKIKSVEKVYTLGIPATQLNPTSLANTPVLQSFPAAVVPKIPNIPTTPSTLDKSLFPQFKIPKP